MVVFTSGKYETGATAGWSEGDWNGDMLFESGDMVTAFTAGSYELGPREAVAAVPEPSGLILFVLGLLALRVRRRWLRQGEQATTRKMWPPFSMRGRSRSLAFQIPRIDLQSYHRHC